MAINPDQLRQPKIMILSDENLVSMLQKHLATFDPAFFRPLNVSDAMEKAKGMDLAIVTLHLAEGGGIEALSRLRSADEDLPVVIFAHSTQFVDVQVAVRKGAADFISLPIDPEILVECIFTACMRRVNLRNRFGALGKLREDNQALAERLKGFQQSVTDFALGILRLRSSTVEAHCRYSAKIAVAFAKYLGWEDDRIDRLRLAALVHDFGYYTMDEKIRQEGPSTNQELFIWKRHPLITKQFLKTIFPDLHWEIVEHHHEMFDGSGFPGQLVGKRASEEIRLFSLVNAFSAKVMPSTLEKGLSTEDAVLHIMNGSGTLFDPELVDRFIRFVSEATI